MQQSSTDSQHTSPSALTGWLALVAFSFQRQWRVRSLGYVTFALLVMMTGAVAVTTHVRDGWRLESAKAWVANPRVEKESMKLSYQEYATERLPLYEMIPGPPPFFAIKTIPIGIYQFLMFAEEAKGFRDQYAFINFSRFVVFGIFHSFLLPLFTLAFASGALGSEREGRTLIWLVTRPMPRWAVYVAKFLGVLPWCVAVGLFGFACLCLAGGEVGRLAFSVYWPSVIGGSVALAALFQLIGAIFRRPAIVGLVYLFFFETLVANLPGSLKRLSLNYYVRSLLYNDAASVATNVKTENLDVYYPLGPTSSWVVLILATVFITALGAWLFSRQEPKDEV
ncbi:hypothetical protein BH11PLA2_BH11PLA2_14010 [soil metagenome]